MPENSTAATDLTSQYTAQVATDLERNVKEQERVASEITALKERLTALQRDHTILVNVQQALSLPPAPDGRAPEHEPEPAGTAGEETASGTATVPAPRSKDGAGPRTAKPRRAKKTAARTAPGKQTRKPSAPKVPKGKRSTAPADTGDDGPTLVDLVRRHLDEQKEPRSAAEVADALGSAHPQRTIRTTVVRSTLESLVARNQAQRTKQGSSVFYTAPDSTGTQATRGDTDAS